MRSIMDSISDLSLLEIAGEDDSLLSDASTATNIFSCSPLLSSRSRPSLTEGRKGGAADSEDPISSSKDSANKENANWSKLEVPKLSVETQQMKKKKKIGGFNLRKSLAWDRAFFTEQGVLNPLELSMISGTTTPNGKSNLEVINEEEPVTTSIALQEIEENLFKHSSEGGVPIGDRRTGARIGLSPKPGALNKLRPLKRANTAKTPGKESKNTRTGGLKPDISANTTAIRSGVLTTGSSKKIQSTHPATNVQKYAGVKGLSKIPRIVPSNPKSDMAVNCSVTRTLTKQTGKNLENAVSKAYSQSIIHQPRSANKVSEACLPRGVLDVDEKKQRAVPVFQTTKSSGLRMPSPSLGFFTQAKASSSHGLPQKNSIPCKPSENNIPIPKLRKLEKVSCKEARTKIVEGATKKCSKELSLLDESEPMQTDNKQMAGVELECDSLGLGKVSKQAKDENILEHVNFKSKEQGELHENENVSSMEKVVFPRHENKLLLKSHTQEQVEKKDDHPDVTKTVQRGSKQGIPCKNTKKINGDAGDFDKCGGGAQNLLLDGNISINCNETTQCNLDAINQQLQEGQLKTPDPIIVGEISSKKEDNKSLVNSCQVAHVETLFSKGSPKKSILETNGASESESKIAEIKDCQLLVNGQSGVIPKRPMDEEYDQVTDSKEMHDRTRAFELKRLSEDCVTVSATACCTKVTDFSLKRPFSENVIEDLCLASQICPSVQADCDSKGNGMSINNSSPISVPQLRDDNFFWDAAIHSDVQRDIPGTFEQQASMFRDPEINEMPCKDESLVPNHCQLLHQSEFSEVSAGLTSKAEYHIGSGAASPSILLLHTPLAQSVQEFDRTTRRIEESHLEEAQMQSFSENPVAYNCSSEQCLAVSNNQFSLADDNNINEDSHLSEFQKSGAVTIDSQNVNDILHLDSDCLPTNISQLEEIKGKKLVEDAFEGCSFRTSEHNASNHQIQAMPEDGEGNHDLDERAEVLLIDDAKKGASDILPLVEVQRNDNILHFNGDCLPTNIASSEEIKEKSLVEGAIEGCSIHTSEHNASDHHIQAKPENKDGNHVDKGAERLQVDDGERGSSDIVPSVEVQVNDDISFAEFDSSVEVSENPVTVVVAWKHEEQCSFIKNPELLASHDATFNATNPQGSEVSPLNSKSFSDEAGTNIFEKDKFPTDMQGQTEGDINSAEDGSKIIHLEKNSTKSTEEVATVKPPPNAAPFSDEWLAAIEAAGEEILTKKSGAVQNSPPDKNQQELGPWSPVKKNQPIGPFDCTKHNLHHSGS